MSQWEMVTTAYPRAERLAVPGGWVYSFSRLGSDVGLVFVPEPKAEKLDSYGIGYADGLNDGAAMAGKKAVAEMMLNGEAGKTVEPLRSGDQLTPKEAEFVRQHELLHATLEQMSRRDLVNLLNRAAAYVEAHDFGRQDARDLIDDLLDAAKGYDL